MKTHPHHTDDCAAVESDDQCEPAGGVLWNQPPRVWVQGAEDQIDDTEAPWCRIRQRAIELMAEA